MTKAAAALRKRMDRRQRILVALNHASGLTATQVAGHVNERASGIGSVLRMMLQDEFVTGEFAFVASGKRKLKRRQRIYRITSKGRRELARLEDLE